MTITRGSNSIGVRQWDGDGPALVLTHGAGLCAGIFEPVIPMLRERWTVLATDLRGHGRSDTPDSLGGHGLSSQALDLFAVLDETGHDRVSVFGHSYGGAVVMRAMLDQPDRFDAVAVYEPAIGHPDDDIETLQARTGHFVARILERPNEWPDRPSMIAGLRSVRAFRELDAQFLDALVDHGTVVDGKGRWRLRCTPEVEAALFQVTLSEDGGCGMQPDLVGLGSAPRPFTLLSGDGSGFRLGLFERVAALAGVPLSVVPGHHFGPFRSLEWFAELVQRYVSPGQQHGVGRGDIHGDGHQAEIAAP